MNKEIKLMAGITPDNEIYFINITREQKLGDQAPYFSMTGETVIPITRTDAVDRVREQLEDGEEWRGAVDAEQTEMSKDDWIDHVLAIDGELAGFDNSLFTNEVTTESGEEYIFESGSCGQHEEKELRTYFIAQEMFDGLMKLWTEYHMKPAPTTPEALKLLQWAEEVAEIQAKEMDQLAVNAIKVINDEDND